MHRKEKYYAVYWGEQILTHGTARECAEKLGVKINTIYKICSPSYLKNHVMKHKGKKEPIMALVVEELDEMGN